MPPKLAKLNPGHPDGTLYRLQVVCADSACKLEDSLRRFKTPDAATGALRDAMADYPRDKIAKGVLYREDHPAAPWETLAA